MVDVAWLRVEFWLLVASSIAVPLFIVVHLLRVEEIARHTLLAAAVALIVLAGVDVVLLKLVTAAAKQSQSLLDDAVFLSESALAFYLLPLLAAGVGINLLSFAITQHLRVKS